ncbi:MAG: thioredoxin family protein [Chloroflexota bacterium]
MRVELLYWDSDPAYMTARQRLVEVLTEDAFETPIQMIAVNSAADAELLEFPGSPTIRIDGVDIHPAGASGAAGAGLRLRSYPSDDALDGPATDPLPGKRLIRRAVEQARGWGHGRHG